jgi:prevent-host-death family protein
VVKPTSLPVHDFRTKLSEIVERAAFKGERFIVTSHGRERAALVSIEDLRLIEEKSANKPAKRQPK